MSNSLTDTSATIAAIATPQGRGGVGIIRLSGANAHAIACQLTQKPTNQPRLKSHGFKPRHATVCRFYAEDGTVLDEGLVLYFNAPHSFTGEDVVELHGHGGVILQNQLLARTLELGAVLAQAGEFSYRAFDNDKLDLVQLESIADAIDATSVAAATSAMRSLTGEFSHKINEVLASLIQLRLYVEASIDFPDEEDVDFLADGVIESKLTSLVQAIEDIRATAKQGQLLRDGVNVVLAGKPNAGKSSLLNRLAGQERAIVTDIAGTTRDTLQETLVLNGLTIHLTDTAGLRDTTDAVERLGIERAKDAIAKADLIILLHDLTENESPMAVLQLLLPAQSSDAQHNDAQSLATRNILLVGNKSDLLSSTVPTQQVMDVQGKALTQINVSCETGVGIEALIATLCEKVGFHPPENSLIARTRHIDALRRTATHLQEAVIQLTEHQAGELVAESLRLAQNSLGEITGEFSSDDLLGHIFSSFCIGK